MKRLDVLAIPGLMLALAVLLASPVYGQAFTETTIVHNGTMPFGVGPNPCTGLMDIGTITYNGVMHITRNPNGVLVTLTQTGDIMVVTQQTGVVYTGHITNSFTVGIHLTADGGFVVTLTFAGRAIGSDGSTIQVNAVQHITVNSLTPPTLPVVEFSNVTIRCS